MIRIAKSSSPGVISLSSRATASDRLAGSMLDQEASNDQSERGPQTNAEDKFPGEVQGGLSGCACTGLVRLMRMTRKIC
jgi:hypothetical protein